MKLADLIHDLSALLPVLGPGAPVLQHERLRIQNDRDSVQVIDPDIESKADEELITLRKETDRLLEELHQWFEDIDEPPRAVRDAVERVGDLIPLEV